MEDIEKYIFDPENPKGFKAYGLLATLAKNKETFGVYIDKHYLIEIFKENLLDKEAIDLIWDKPSNFHSLTANEKIKIFIQNYSDAEYEILLKQKIPKFSKEKLKGFIPNFLVELRNGILLGSNSLKEFTTVISESFIETHIFGKNFFLDSRRGRKRYYSTEFHNNLIFISNDLTQLIPILTKARILKVSVLITNIKNKNHETILSLNKNIRPIFLQEDNDIHKLIDLVKRNSFKVNPKKYPKNILSRIQKSHLKNYFSIKNIILDNLSKKKEIYLIGENGDGKSLILQGILLSLIGNQNIGIISDFIKQNGLDTKLFLKANDDKNNLYGMPNSNKELEYNQVFAYGVNRFQNDSDKKDPHGFLTLFSYNEYLENPVKWLQHLDYQEKSGNKPDIELSKAKELLNYLLEKNVLIEVSPDGVDFYERGTKLKFNQLSDGYKSVLVWMCDLLSRLATKQPDVEHISDFHGIVLVDEIGMFLHPKWQRTIVKKLRTTFPNIQFFFTTHSPIVLLGASEDAVFYKVYKEEGETKVSDPIENKSLGHLMANGILTAPFLFGLESAHSESYDPKTDNLDTSDDYLTGKIHEAVSKKIAAENNISEDKIMELIQQELDKYQAQETETND